MEKHHLLRRDPSWAPNGCNICGQVGHQASSCPNGTVNWRETYGDEAFVLKGPIYYSDILARENSKKKHLENLEGRAKEYAKARAAKEGLNWEDIQSTAARLQAMTPEETIKPVAVPITPIISVPFDGLATNGTMGLGPIGSSASTAPATAVATAAPSTSDALPPGWSIAYDANNKPYYWNRLTKKVQWDLPTEAAAAS
uniref:CCHC-type domain-containing protein n=1 Tax=Polytomella parva TaxID=51329 RepID=A0A7S0Y7Q7_9CHLO|mmetsp:Transcript_11951/g.21436  ORF Transcript_11951/g.21436 Transcript_11951/m.21436 type:complete len:199 (+) Transcript_11951:1-597(+)